MSGSGTSTASGTSTGCPASSPARSGTVGPSWPRPRPARPTTLAYFPIWSYAHPRAVELADRLAELTPGDCNRIFFTTGGSEAVESAWKLARQYFRLTGQPERSKVISRDIAYHGATMGALSITGLADIKTAFEPLVPGAIKVPNTNFYRAKYFADDLEAFGRWAADAIEQAILIEGPDTVAAVFLEPVQNAGGCFPPPPGYFQRVREICDRYGVLLVSDEVICAFGRLGHWFGAERYDYQPDIVTMAKGLTSGYSPLGAMAVSDRLVEPFLHGRQQLPPRHHLRRPPGELGGGAGQPRRLREGAPPRARAQERAELPGRPGDPLRPAHRRATSGGRATSTASRWCKDKDTRETFDDDEAERLLRGLPVRRPLRGRADLPGRRPGRPGDPAGPAAHLRRGRVRRDDLHPPHRADRGVEADLTRRGPSGTARLSLWWDSLPGPLGVRPPLAGDTEVDVAVVGRRLHRPVDRLLPGRGRPHASGSPSSSATWSASGPRAATAAGARPCSPPPRRSSTGPADPAPGRPCAGP